MRLTRNTLVAWLAGVALPSAGCTYFRSQEPISASNASRLHRAYLAKLADLSPLERLGGLLTHDPPFPITGAAVDSARDLLFVYRQYPTGGRLSSGLEGFRLSTGLTVLPTPIPPPEIAHEGFDLSRVQPPMEWSFRTFLPNPRVDAYHFLLIRENERFEQTHIRYVQAQTLKVEAEFPIPAAGGRDLCFEGGAGRYLLAGMGLDQYAPRNSLCVLMPRDDHLEIVRRLMLDDGWNVTLNANVIDWQQNRWVVWQDRRRSRLNGRRVRVYAIPSLENLAEYDWPVPDRNPVWIPGSSLIAMVPESDDRNVVLLDMNTGAEVARCRLDPPGTDEYCGWFLFSDPQGRYLGAHGCLWVQLFAIQRPDTNGRISPESAPACEGS